MDEDELTAANTEVIHQSVFANVYAALTFFAVQAVLCEIHSIAYAVCCLQVHGIVDGTDSIGEVVERNKDLLQAFVKSLLMVCQGTAAWFCLPGLSILKLYVTLAVCPCADPGD